MPVYEYKCRECGEISEYRVTAPDEKGSLACKSCGSPEIDRKISVPSISSGARASSGHTCCGKTERCEKPPCSTGGHCRRP